MLTAYSHANYVPLSASCVQALVQYPDEATAEQAKDYLDGHCMYPNNRNKVRARGVS